MQMQMSVMTLAPKETQPDEFKLCATNSEGGIFIFYSFS